jgi:carboxy-cis,cis-muconate cyclase
MGSIVNGTHLNENGNDDRRRLIAGTFNTSQLFTLSFSTGKCSLVIESVTKAQAPHSWLALDASRKKLYATSWTEPPGLAAYSISSDDGRPTLIGSVRTRARSGYVSVTDKAVYSAGGPTGEAFSLSAFERGVDCDDEPIQLLEFVDEKPQKGMGGATLDFGGLRHGAHSVDLSPDGRKLFIADM